MEPSLSSIPASKTLRVRKYAAKFRLVDHAGAHQRFYLRLLCAKRAVWSGVPEFAAYFCYAIPKVRGNRDLPPRPQFRASAICCFVAKNQFVLGGFKFLPALPKIGPFSNDMRCPRVLCQVRRALRKMRPSQPTPRLASIMATDNHNASAPRD